MVNCKSDEHRFGTSVTKSSNWLMFPVGYESFVHFSNPVTLLDHCSQAYYSVLMGIPFCPIEEVTFFNVVRHTQKPINKNCGRLNVLRH